jgi:transposase
VPVRFQLVLTAAQRHELQTLRDRAPKPHLREKAAAVLKVADGASLRAVARAGLLRPRRTETVSRWVQAYQRDGPAAFGIRAGRGRKPAFSPSGSGHRA